MVNKPKISFLLSFSPNPRMKKRINLLKTNYITSLIYWKRTEKNIWGRVEGEIETVEINILSNNGKPLLRIIPTVKFAFRALRSLHKIKPDCIYVQNLDMLCIAFAYKIIFENKVKLIYEIADIHSLLIDHQRSLLKKIAQIILRRIDRKLCKYIDLLVNTSDKFYDVYYSKFVPKEKLLVIPNIPDVEVFKNYKKKTCGEFTVGFIGAIRYKEQMKMLINAAKKANIRVLFAGSGIDNEIENMCCGYDHVSFYGEYDYKTEISKLYGMVDCIYSVYDADMTNVKIAIPNKLYEAIFCELPIIVAKGTYLAELVEKMGVGISVSHKNEIELFNVLNLLRDKGTYYNQYVDACRIYRNQINLASYNKKLIEKIRNEL